MQTVTIEDVQARLPEILDQLPAGGEVVIVRDGTPVGRLVPPVLPKGVPIYGRAKGMLIINDDVDDDEHLKDFAAYMP